MEMNVDTTVDRSRMTLFYTHKLYTGIVNIQTF
jgi:hypothetical protein